MAGNFHHAPNIGAKSRSPNILGGISIRKKNFLLMISSEKYIGKTLHFKGMVMKSKDFPEDTFVPGRNIMTCCEADIRFLGFLCRYKGIVNIKRRSWVAVTATLKMEYSEIYGEEGPVLYASEVALTRPPERETVSF